MNWYVISKHKKINGKVWRVRVFTFTVKFCQFFCLSIKYKGKNPHDKACSPKQLDQNLRSRLQCFLCSRVIPICDHNLRTTGLNGMK